MNRIEQIVFRLADILLYSEKSEYIKAIIRSNDLIETQKTELPSDLIPLITIPFIHCHHIYNPDFSYLYASESLDTFLAKSLSGIYFIRINPNDTDVQEFINQNQDTLQKQGIIQYTSPTRWGIIESDRQEMPRSSTSMIAMANTYYPDGTSKTDIVQFFEI